MFLTACAKVRSHFGHCPTARRSDSTEDYRHPYYWAAFILMGNWGMVQNGVTLR